MAGTKDLITAIKAATPECRAGVFGGLLSLGDDRICGLLWPLRWDLSLPELSVALEVHNDFRATGQYLVHHGAQEVGPAGDGLGFTFF